MKRSAAAAVLLFAACTQTAPVTPPPPPPVAQPAAAVEAPAPAPAPRPTEPRELAKYALGLYQQKRWEEAVPALAEAAELNAFAAPFLRLRLLEAQRERGEFAAAANVAAQIIATAPNTSAATIAKLRIPALYLASGDVVAAEASYAQIVTLPLDDFVEAELVDLATRLEKGGRIDLATNIRMRLLRELTNGRYTEKTYGQLRAMADSPLDKLSFDESLKLAQQLARADRYDQALDFFEHIERRFPDAGAKDAYRATRLRALFNSRNYSTLIAETEGVKLNDPALVLLRARAAWRDDKPEMFLAGLRQVEREWPSSPEAINAKVLRAKYYVTDETNHDLSIDNLKAAIDAGAMGNEGENLWNLGFTYVLAGRFDDALKTFDRYVRTYPDSDYTTNSLFWSGKVLRRLGRMEEGNAKFAELIGKYPYSYFAYRARELASSSFSPPRGEKVPQADEGSAAVFPNIATNLPLIDELEALGLHRDAAREMRAIAAASPDDLALQFRLADVYVRGGEPFKANGILQRKFRQFVRHGGANVPKRFWEILFPLAYWPAIQTEAQRRNLDPYLVASIIRQESGFEPTTVSNAGAVGLMQIMPNEAGRIAANAGLTDITRDRLFDPETNIAVGAAEYAQKLATMRGNHVLAIAAYNAGEQAVGNWLARTAIDDIDLFVETIPYAETRLYVKSVSRNRHEYRRIYEGSTAVQQQVPSD